MDAREGKNADHDHDEPEREMLLEQVGVDYIVEYPFDEEVRHMAPEQFISDILVGG